MKRACAVLAVVLLLVVGVACGSSEDAKPATSVVGASTAGASPVATQVEAAATESASEAAPEGTTGGAAPAEGDAENGKSLATSLGCVACHSVDGSTLVGPTWKGVYGHEVTLTDGSKVTVDDAYIHESIVDPNAKVVEGFAPIMPGFKGQVDDQQIADIIAYIKTLQ